MENDFEEFKLEASWFVQPNAVVTLDSEKQIRLSEEFKRIFPRLTTLIEKARVTHLNINSQPYTLYAWDNTDNQICGWLNMFEDINTHQCELIEEHKLLLKNIGGIKESFNQPKDSFTENQNYMFISSECSRGIGHYDDYYSMTCEEAGFNEIDYSNFIEFTNEANGALTLYESKTKEVLLFSHDHSFTNIKFLDNQPAYTFHKLANASNFIEYVEELAKQWMKDIK